VADAKVEAVAEAVCDCETVGEEQEIGRGSEWAIFGSHGRAKTAGL